MGPVETGTPTSPPSCPPSLYHRLLVGLFSINRIAILPIAANVILIELIFGLLFFYGGVIY